MISRFTRLALQLGLLALGTLLLVPCSTFAGLVPSDKPAAYPDWWFERDVLVTRPDAPARIDGPLWSEDYPAADDYAVANIGQLKYFARKAYDEFQHVLPPSVWTETPGLNLKTTIRSWYLDDELTQIQTSGTDHYAVVNQGQLKQISSLFYVQLAEFGYSGPPLDSAAIFPWTDDDDEDDDHFAAVNLGQLKHVFSFDLNYLPEISTAGLRLWLRSDRGVPATGPMSNWLDQSGLGNHAYQTDPDKQPQIVADEMNGRPVVRFDGVDDRLELPSTYMAGATGGEIFIVNRAQNLNATWQGLAHLGNGEATIYVSNGNFYDDFGSDIGGEWPGPGAVTFTRAHIFNSSINPAGDHFTRFDGVTVRALTGRSVSYRGDPILGNDHYGEAFGGDITEVIVYDRELTEAERDEVYSYLADKYAPPGITAPVAPVLSAHVLSSTAVDLSWTTASGADLSTLERQVGDGAFTTVATLDDQFSYTDTTLTAGQTYTYRVKLTSYAGESAYSAPVTITTPVGVALPPDSGLRLWLRSTAGLPATNAVAEWKDQSGLGNHASQTQHDQRPTLAATTLNGRPALHFDGQNDFLALPNVMDTATAGEVFMVLRLEDFSRQTYNNFLDLSAGDSATKYTPELLINGFGINGEVIHPRPSNPATVTIPHLFNSSISAAGLQECRINSTLEYSESGFSVAFRPDPKLGNNNYMNGFFGDIAEVLIYDRVLSPAERIAVIAYLEARYGLNLSDATAPTSPTDLSVTNLDCTSFTLSWSASSDDVAVNAYDIYRDAILVGSTGGATTSYDVTGLTPDTSYAMTVVARDASGNASAPSAALSVTTLADIIPPTVPSGVSALNIDPTSFTLSWDASSDNVAVAAYDVYRDAVFIGSTGGATTSYDVAGLTPDTSYAMTVVALDTSGNASAPSAPLSVTTVLDLEPPSVPSDLVTIANLGDRVTLAWAASTDNVGIATYEVYRNGMLVGSTVAIASPRFTVTGLAPATTYDFTVLARDGTGNASAQSAPLAVTTSELPVGAGLRLWLRADLGSPASGSVETWQDQSGSDNHAIQANPGQQPVVVANAVNGLPVLRFTEGQSLNLPNLLGDATAGEIIAVMKVGSKTIGQYSNENNDPWNFGQPTGYYGDPTGSTYYHYNGFGVDPAVGTPGFPVSRVSDYHIHNTATSPALWSERYNGLLTLTATGHVVNFSSTPYLGVGFVGDIAEILVYDRVLTEAERVQVSRYLAAKYEPSTISAPTAPTLSAYPVSSTSVDLVWSVPDGDQQLFTTTLERQDGGGAFAPVSTAEDALAHTDVGLTAGQSYTYRVKVENILGAATYSPSATVVMSIGLGAPPSAGMRLWLRSTAGLPANGAVAEWKDQSGLGNHANQTQAEQRPLLVADTINGRPALHFDHTQNQHLALPDLMAGATGGEAFALIRRADTPGHIAGLWQMGPGSGSRYPEYNNQIHDDFASDQWTTTGPAPALISSFHLYNVGGDSTQWFQRLNGTVYTQRTGNTVGFSSTPNLGMSGVPFAGDIVEVLVYDRVLMPLERAAVQSHFYAKYRLEPPDTQAPSAPLSLVLNHVAPTYVTLSWSGAQDNISITAYELYRDGQLLAVTEDTQSTVSALTPSSTYQFTVRARDAAGNFSAFSPPLSVTTLSAGGGGVFVDTDNDGMPDAWELAIGLDPALPGDGISDPDGDGLSNLAEYRSGTNPYLFTTLDTADALPLRVISP